MNKIIDLRSDTVTQPTAEMRRLISGADVGDDVYQEDPSVNKLEQYAAELVGKEAALFVVSGTMGNLIALLTHTRPGEEVILEANVHIFYYEVGGISRIAGLVPRLLPGKGGLFTCEQLQSAIRGDDIHFPRTSLVCLENTHNRAGGCVLPQEEVLKLAAVAQNAGLKLHLDGARIFNAAAATGLSAQELAQPFDSVMFCLSKGLAAPVGSMLAGSGEFIARARKARKMLGGGLRQAGFMAAAGLESLQAMTQRLTEDHRRARQLAQDLGELPGLNVTNSVQTNMVMLQIDAANLSAAALAAKWKEDGILAIPTGSDTVRLVTHYQITDEDLNQVLTTTRRILEDRLN